MAAGDLALLREVRLRALAESPQAFGSSYAREAAFSDEKWRAGLERYCDPARGIGLLALDEGRVCGLVGCIREDEIRDEDDTERGLIISMWTAPEVRRRGVGAQLLGAAESWAREHGLAEIRLRVHEHNAPALELYRRAGFHETGEWDPFPNEPGGRNLYMAKRLQAG
jgi:ribosomal protein S18 acetylase RimI-like enzyme